MMGDGYAVEEYPRAGERGGDFAVGIELRSGQRGRSQVGAEDGDDLARARTDEWPVVRRTGVAEEAGGVQTLKGAVAEVRQ